MKRFKFRLERVLDYKRTLENDCRRELLQWTAKVNEAQARIQFLESERSRDHIPTVGVIPIHELNLAGNYGERIRKEIEHGRLEVIRLEDEREKARVKYSEAAKEVKTLETLKARRQSEYDEYIRKEEEKILDEMSVQKGNTMGGMADKTN
jgi:flagellar protein FliJ